MAGKGRQGGVAEGMQENFDLELAASRCKTDIAGLLAALEGVLFAAGMEGLTDAQIARIFFLTEESVADFCGRLAAKQDAEGRMLCVIRSAGSWQLVTRPELTPYLRDLAMVPPPSALSTAALETLAIIAYKQPITRAGIEHLRGVKSDRALSTLIVRGLVDEAGRADGPGRPILYATTKDFLDHFGLASPSELPHLDEYRSDNE